MDYFREEGTCMVFTKYTHNVANVFIYNEISKMGKSGFEVRDKKKCHQRIKSPVAYFLPNFDHAQSNGARNVSITIIREDCDDFYHCRHFYTMAIESSGWF